MKSFNKIHKFGVILFLIIFGGCGKQWKDNSEYINYLSSLIIEFRTKTGHLPESLDETISYLGIRLNNKGDVNGHSLLYVKAGDAAFMIRSYGANGIDELGSGDDYESFCIDKNFVRRDEFILHLKKEKAGFYWSIYYDLFEGKK